MNNKINTFLTGAKSTKQKPSPKKVENKTEKEKTEKEKTEKEKPAAESVISPREVASPRQSRRPQTTTVQPIDTKKQESGIITDEEMPSPEIVDIRFTAIEKDLGLPPGTQLSIDKKWLLVKQKQTQTQSITDVQIKTELDEIFKNLSKGRKGVKPEYLIKVRTMVDTKPVSWVRRFVEGGGFEHLFSIFRESIGQLDSSSKDIIAECVRCLKGTLNIDSSIFEKIVETGDGLSLVTKSVKYLSAITQAEIFEILAVICFSGKERMHKGYHQILQVIRNEVGFQFLVETLTTKYPDLRINTLLFINGLLWGTDDPGIQAQILADLDAAEFRSIFDAISKTHQDDELWRKQIDIFYNFEEDYAESAAGMNIRLKTQIQKLEEEVKFLHNKSIKQAELIDAYSIAPAARTDDSIVKEVSRLQMELRKKDEIIHQLEQRIPPPTRSAPPSDLPPPPSHISGHFLPSAVSAGNIPFPDGPPPPTGPPPIPFSPPPHPGLPPTLAGGSNPSHPPPPPGVPPPGPPPSPGGPPPPPPGSGEPPPPPGSGGPPPPPPPGSGGPPPPPPGSGGPPPPPPPGGGGPPPPPPPPGGRGPPPPPGGGPPGGPEGGFALPPKKVIKPSKKMRGLMWQKLPPKNVTESIWKSLDDENVKIPAKDLEDFFGVDPEPPKEKHIELEAASKAVSISILDPKRSNNVEIMLRGLKMDPVEIKNALMNMDNDPETGLSADKLKAIQLNLPSPDEIAMIEGYEGDKTELGNAEKYYSQISKVPLISIRVESLEYKSSFEAKSKDLLHSLNTLLAAIKIVKSEKRFHKILEIILGLGNYLNGSTKLGQTHGFKLQSLVKLADVRSTKNPSTTLVHYLADLLARDHKELFSCLKEFGPVHESARESASEVGKQVIQLIGGLPPIQKQLESATCDAAYAKAMRTWVAEAQKTCEELSQKNTAMQNGLKEAFALLAEPPTSKSEEFFGLLSSFVTSIEQAYIFNEKKKAEIAAAAAKEKKAAALPAKSPKKVNVLDPSNPPAEKGKGGEFETILASMKSGGAFADRSTKRKTSEIPSYQSIQQKKV